MGLCNSKLAAHSDNFSAVGATTSTTTTNSPSPRQSTVLFGNDKTTLLFKSKSLVLFRYWVYTQASCSNDIRSGKLCLHASIEFPLIVEDTLHNCCLIFGNEDTPLYALRASGSRECFVWTLLEYTENRSSDEFKRFQPYLDAIHKQQLHQPPPGGLLVNSGPEGLVVDNNPGGC